MPRSINVASLRVVALGEDAWALGEDAWALGEDAGGQP